MKTLQEQTKKVVPEATFEDICPDWNKIIAKEGGFDKVDVDKDYTVESQEHTIKNYQCCVVGEAFNIK